ncbi:GLE1-like protein-domain-containing protein [Podospora didyma]|uniref:mRNA export factor GLE1 n=1 Tax=Podospora didyma TaxID=330526 RepID=A0AAE0NCE9_9PEZI|nr:GLE1-like protein-domain-containing protein [Podospora didyma]
MADSSPARRQSSQWTSPPSAIITELLGDDRNSEEKHKQLLEIAKREHQRVREEAERAHRNYLQRQERQRILDEKAQEEERIKLEEQIATERLRLHALKLKKVEIPPSPPPPEPAKVQLPPAQTTLSTAPPGASAQNPFAQVNGNSTSKPEKPAAAATTNPFGAPSLPASAQLAPAPQPPVTTKPPTFPGGVGSLLNNTLQNNGVSASFVNSQPKAPPPVLASVDRYTIIHQNLKALRKSVVQQGKTNEPLRIYMGNMRRKIRMHIGQLTGGGGQANRMPQSHIFTILRESFANSVQSEPVDPGNFVLEPRNPAPGALHNDPQVPSVFIYLLNSFGKLAINQFITETSARPETADPIGVCIATTFSDPELLWRGKSMIDVLMAKFRIVCPVIFGYRGSEKTEQGRQRLGWWKDSGEWVPEQVHMDRMTGLGAGFAAISLRNFARAKKENPYPPRHYWTAMAKIVNTPAAEISNTQCVVLKAMIENYEQKFLEFYGTAGLAALRAALVEFPARALVKSPAVHSLEVVAQVLQRDTGLNLG